MSKCTKRNINVGSISVENKALILDALTLKAYCNKQHKSGRYAQNQKPKEKLIVPVEVPFAVLKFEKQSSPKFGSYLAAYERRNAPDTWIHALNILLEFNASMQNRFVRKGFAFNYFLYGHPDKIYQQKLRSFKK